MKHFIALAIVAACFSLHASGFEVNGIYYKALSPTTAQVIPINSSSIGSGDISIGINYGYSGDVVIPETVTYNGADYQVVSAEDGVFASSSKMTSISLPATLTELGPSPFESCSKLTSITVAASNPVYCSEGGVLYNKDKSTLIAVPGGSTGNFTVPSTVTTIDNSAFYGCFRLTSISIPETVEEIGTNAFRACTSLSSINIPSNITEIKNGTFNGCSTLKAINIPDGVKTIGDYAFYYCRNLSQIQFPSALTSIGDYTFCTCYQIPVINIPEGVKSIGIRAFESCRTARVANLPSTLETIGAGIFRGCTSLPSINLTSGNTHFTIDNGVLLDIDKTMVICCPGGYRGSYEIPSTVKVIEEYAFYLCKNLSSVKLPEGLTTIRIASFTNCTLLETITLPSTLRTIGKSTFVGCSGIQSVFSYSKTPPIISSEAYSSPTYSVPLYVPGSSSNLYKNADYWKNFNITRLIGDVNQDGEISVVDVMMLVSHVTGTDSDDSFEPQLGDLNNDGEISVVDVMSLVDYVVGN